MSKFRGLGACGLLLVGHGTRSVVGTSQFLTLAGAIAHDAAPLVVEPAFLELQQPDIDFAVGRLVERGISRLVTLPLLLFAAGHAKRDVPEQVAVALARHSAHTITSFQAAHLGCHNELVELSKRRMEETLTPAINAGNLKAITHDSCLLLVGRGNHDESATAEMHEFGKLRQQASEGLATEVAFLAMAQPRLETKLAELAQSSFRRIIVQPHLLFDGELWESIQSQVSQIASQQPEKKWLIVPPLADQPGLGTWGTKLLRIVILDRCNEAVIRVVAGEMAD